MNILSTRAHGVIDYATGALLILAPYLFGFSTGGVEQWIPQLLGLAILGMSLIGPLAGRPASRKAASSPLVSGS